MTIKKSLILSHISMCILPFLMTFFVLLSSFAGLYLYAKSGNHVMAESDFQFQVMSQLVRTSIFHNIRHGEDPMEDHWVLDIMDPIQSYVVLYKDGAAVMQYGNDAYQRMVDELKQKKVQQELDEGALNGTYSRTRMGQYSFMERSVVGGHVYHLYMLSHKPLNRSDAAIEAAFHASNRFIVIMLVIFIGLVSYGLSRFIVRRILTPLQVLERGAREVQQGNLSVHLTHEGKDEFTPALSAFNLMTDKLSQSLREREENEARRKELIASVSHDIRTPLTAIRAYVEGLLDHVADTPEKEEHYLRVIEKKSGVLERLIEQLLLLTKMDLGEKALPLVSIDLSKLTKDFIDENRLLWEKQGADFHMETEGVQRMAGNALLLERILENLITNSIRYKKEERVQIDVTVKAAGGEICLSVADDGIGAPKEALSRLTEAFYRTDLARSHTDKGSGLGLAIVKRAVMLMHGRLSIENRTPHGLLVQISFPKEENNETYIDRRR